MSEFKKDPDLLNGKGEDDITWITVNGSHIPIKDGQSPRDAMNERFGESDSKQSVQKMYFAWIAYDDDGNGASRWFDNKSDAEKFISDEDLFDSGAVNEFEIDVSNEDWEETIEDPYDGKEVYSVNYKEQREKAAEQKYDEYLQKFNELQDLFKSKGLSVSVNFSRSSKSMYMDVYSDDESVSLRFSDHENQSIYSSDVDYNILFEEFDNRDIEDTISNILSDLDIDYD